MVKRKKQTTDTDGTFFLRLALYLIIGSQWVRLVDPEFTKQVPIPIGLIAGMVFASHEHFKIDRKIEYALLLAATFMGFWTNTGLFLTVL